jgi:hypothetical protein
MVENILFFKSRLNSFIYFILRINYIHFIREVHQLYNEKEIIFNNIL